uniref:Uncharacterized protein n=1 Tax=Picea sitchensis TaxID=3332 RepID=A9NTQ5_PICSI|nr:unknown [Picea sitchensis]ABK25096.1 unknown [Picea sitchensis]ABK26172.1 unknown [Picea sitchensis]
MGSYISCASNTVPSSTVKVIHWNGSVQDLQRRITAAELMLDNPQHFVCHANGLQIGRRINPLTADEELDLGYLYFLLPMPKLHSVLSGADMASLAFKANSAMKATKRRSSGARVLPLFDDFMRPLPPEMKKDVFLSEGKQINGAQEEQLTVPKLNLEDDPELSTALAQLRLNPSKSWKPKLETIEEFRPKLRDLMQSNIEQFC